MPKAPILMRIAYMSLSMPDTLRFAQPVLTLRSKSPGTEELTNSEHHLAHHSYSTERLASTQNWRDAVPATFKHPAS